MWGSENLPQHCSKLSVQCSVSCIFLAPTSIRSLFKSCIACTKLCMHEALHKRLLSCTTLRNCSKGTHLESKCFICPIHCAWNRKRISHPIHATKYLQTKLWAPWYGDWDSCYPTLQVNLDKLTAISHSLSLSLSLFVHSNKLRQKSKSSSAAVEIAPHALDTHAHGDCSEAKQQVRPSNTRSNSHYHRFSALWESIAREIRETRHRPATLGQITLWHACNSQWYIEFEEAVTRGSQSMPSYLER